MFHGQSTPSLEPRGELSSFYDEHSRVVHVHDPVRTIFDTSDSMPAVDNSFSDNARALYRVSRIRYNRVVIPAAHARKCLDPGESWTCAPATGMIGRRVSDNFDVRKVATLHERSAARSCISRTILGLCVVAFLHTRAFPQQATPRVLSPTQLPVKGLAQHPFLYAGEWDTRKPLQTLWVVRDGKVVWSYGIPINDANGVLQELGDASMLSNGNIVFSRKVGASEITPDKKIIWNYMSVS